LKSIEFIKVKIEYKAKILNITSSILNNKKMAADYIAPLNHLSAASGLGGFSRSWSCKTCAAKIRMMIEVLRFEVDV